MKLSKRLGMVASMVTRGNRVADVGCDHGFVPIWLVENGVSPCAIAADVRQGPIERARFHVAEHGLEGKIEVRLSDGLENIKPCEAQTLIMSGIGGLLMIRLLKDGEKCAKSFKELILSPQSDLAAVREYLVKEGYCIDYEHMVCDEGKFYFIFHVTVKKDERVWGRWEYRYGRDICSGDLQVFAQYLDHEGAVCSLILEKMAGAPCSPKQAGRRRELAETMKYLEMRRKNT